jgi:acyl-CoA reductase-like NAD-dependent aldehyde dehydrogenase
MDLKNPRLLVGSDWVSCSETRDIFDPYSGERVAKVPFGDQTLVEQAIAAGQAAFSKTRLSAPFERAQVLQRVSAGIEKYRADFVDLLIREAAKPITFAEGEVTRAATTFLAAAEEARRLSGEMLDMEGHAVGRGHLGITRRFPIGVIAGITPFNFPLNLVAHKVAPCLATGNTMVLKPAIKTPLCSLLLGEILLDAGMPPGQVNIVTCSNEDALHLIAHPAVAMISFTGSPDVGWKLKPQAGKKKVCLELGGNAAVIVHEDADLAAAIPAIATGGFSYAGQSCISVQRILVHQPVYAAFKEKFLDHVRNHIAAGDPRDKNTVVGPLINAAARDKIFNWIRSATNTGAALLCGGKTDGPCLLPTVLENVPHDHPLWAQEAFAPVVVLESYTTFEQALDLVNASAFGLQAGVFTQDLNRALAAFDRLDVGGVLVNQVPTFRVENMPYGGVKDSGFGREGIRYAMEEMTELKSLIVHTSPQT